MTQKPEVIVDKDSHSLTSFMLMGGPFSSNLIIFIRGTPHREGQITIEMIQRKTLEAERKQLWVGLKPKDHRVALITMITSITSMYEFPYTVDWEGIDAAVKSIL